MQEILFSESRSCWTNKTMEMMDRIRYINMCIVEFGKKFGMTAQLSYLYLKRYNGLAFLDKCYEAEHLQSLDSALDDLKIYCKRHGGTIR